MVDLLSTKDAYHSADSLTYAVYTPHRADLTVEERGADDNRCCKMLGADKRNSEVRAAQQKSENHHAQQLESSAIRVTQPRHAYEPM